MLYLPQGILYRLHKHRLWQALKSEGNLLCHNSVYFCFSPSSTPNNSTRNSPQRSSSCFRERKASMNFMSLKLNENQLPSTKLRISNLYFRLSFFVVFRIFSFYFYIFACQSQNKTSETMED